MSSSDYTNLRKNRLINGNNDGTSGTKTHNIIMEAIKYLKSINCKFLNLGNCETYYNIDQNEFNSKFFGIERFKKSFGGIQNTYVIYNKKKF